MTVGAGTQEADPQSRFLEELFQKRRSTLELMLVVILAAGFELASSLGLFVSLSATDYQSGKPFRQNASTTGALGLPEDGVEAVSKNVEVGRGEPRRIQAIADQRTLAEFVRARLEPKQNAVLPLSDALRAYEGWCTDRRALQTNDLTITLAMLCKSVGFTIVGEGEEQRVVGLRLRAKSNLELMAPGNERGDQG